MAKCKNCGTGGGMAPAQIDPQGFQQATIQGNQYGQGGGTNFTPGPRGSLLKGSSGFIANTPTQSPQQMGLSNNLIGQIGPLLQQLQSGQGRYEGFEPIEQENKNRFNNEVLPSLAQNFVNMTGDSQFGGGGYAGQLGKAYNQSATGIAALKAQYGLQNQGHLLQQLSTLLGGAYQPQFQTNYISPTQGLLGAASPALGRIVGGGLGALAGGAFGGPAGALAGAGVGSGLGDLFK